MSSADVDQTSADLFEDAEATEIVEAHEERHLPAVRQGASLAEASELTPEGLLAQVQLIQKTMQLVMKNGEHYGIIPGTNKPSLLKPGAEKLCLLFRFDPQYEIAERWLDDGHLYVRATCYLIHPSGRRPSGVGACSTMEEKYGMRNAERVCPSCGVGAIIKGKAEYGGGWLCFKKKGGCGAKFSDGAQEIESQESGKVVNPNLPDTYNTVVKMACKRALVAAVLNGTAASDIFTQDMEDTTPPASPAPGPGEPQQAEGGAPAEPAAAPARLLASKGAVDALRGIIAKLPEDWTEETILEGARTHYNRPIASLDALYQDEIAEIGKAAKAALGESEPAPEAPKKPTEGMVKKMNILVGKLREAGKLTTAEVLDFLQVDYTSAGAEEALPPGTLDAEGGLHFGPVRDTLNRDEAKVLIDWLTEKETA